VHGRHGGWAHPAGRLAALPEIRAFTRGMAVAIPCRVMNAMPQPTASPVAPVASGTPAGYHGAVSDFKRRLIEATLHQMRGNRTHTARALGLQRTYLFGLCPSG
jgi:DNA-binding NtrC family response regulator